MPPSGKVDRKMKGRLQSGGAVLWFLRKHAPMPTPFSNLSRVECFGDATDNGQPQAEVPPRPATSLGFTLDRPQQQFLHNAVKCIGTELEEMHPAAAPLMRVRGGHTNAHRNRQALKYAFAKHSESECDRLRQDLSLKEAEVRDLRLKVQQMERWVQATKYATQKRNARARAAANFQRSNSKQPDKSTGSKSMPVSARSSWTEEANAPMASASMSTRTSGFARRNSQGGRKDTEESVSVKEVQETAEDNKDSPVKRAEEWQHVIARQAEVVKALKAKIQDAEASCNRATIQKKSMEMGLFLAESEVMKLRALAKSSEDRATELANELKRVYQDLPKVMEKRIAAVAKTTSLEVKQKQFESLKLENREEHFKFLDNEALQLENAGVDERAQQLSIFCSDAEKLLNSNREASKNLEKKVVECRECMGFLQVVWSKMVKRALEDQKLAPQPTEEMDEGPELLLYRAGSGLDQCLELLSMQGRRHVDAPSRSASPEGSKNLKLNVTASSLSQTQSTRVPSPTPTSKMLGTSRSMASSPSP